MSTSADGVWEIHAAHILLGEIVAKVHHTYQFTRCILSAVTYIVASQELWQFSPISTARPRIFKITEHTKCVHQTGRVKEDDEGDRTPPEMLLPLPLRLPWLCSARKIGQSLRLIYCYGEQRVRHCVGPHGWGHLHLHRRLLTRRAMHLRRLLLFRPWPPVPPLATCWFPYQVRWHPPCCLTPNTFSFKPPCCENRSYCPSAEHRFPHTRRHLLPEKLRWWPGTEVQREGHSRIRLHRRSWSESWRNPREYPVRKEQHVALITLLGTASVLSSRAWSPIPSYSFFSSCVWMNKGNYEGNN